MGNDSQQMQDIFTMILNQEPAIDLLSWVEINAIAAIAATCKNLKCIAGQYCNRKFSASVFELDDGFRLSQFSHKIGILKETIQNIRIYGVSEVAWDLISSCTNLKHITIYYMRPARLKKMTIAHGEKIKTILKKIESINLVMAIIKGDLHDCILRHCEKLKQLELIVPSKEFFKDTQLELHWLTRHYPTLENFRLRFENEEDYQAIPQLKSFFENNSQIKRLGVDAYLIHNHAEALLNSKIELNDLVFHQRYIVKARKDAYYQSVFDKLEKLHKKGFYKKIYLIKLSKDDEKLTPNFIKLPGLETIHCQVLYLPHVHRYSNLRKLLITNGKFDYFGNRITREHIPHIAEKLSKLQQLYFEFADIDDILPFIKQSIGLNEIRIDKIKNIESFKLEKLNEVREGLPSGKRVLIYTKEKSFMCLKWKYNTLKMHMIELKSAESYEGDNPFFSTEYMNRADEYSSLL